MHRQGLPIKDIAGITGFDRKTIRKWRLQPGPPRYGPRPPRPSKLDPYKPYIDQRLSAGLWNATVLLRELPRAGLPRRLHDSQRLPAAQARERGRRRYDASRLHRASKARSIGLSGYAGHRQSAPLDVELCADIGPFARDVCRVATDQKLETLLQQHEEACQYLGGGAGRDIHDANNVILLGPAGGGQDASGRRPGGRRRARKLRANFITAHDMVTDLGRACREGRLDRRLRIYLAPKVLVIDEMGYLPLDDLGATIFFQLISARYERGSIIFTSNKSYGDWGGSSGSDHRDGYLILDRLLHHSTTVNIR